MEEINLIFAEKLQELRKVGNMKQELLAKELKISQQAYSKLERGALNFTPNIINAICHYFNISVSTFLNTGNQVKIYNSPQANTKNSFNNETKLIDELLKSREDVITSLKKQIELLEAMLKKSSK